MGTTTRNDLLSYYNIRKLLPNNFFIYFLVHIITYLASSLFTIRLWPNFCIKFLTMSLKACDELHGGDKKSEISSPWMGVCLIALLHVGCQCTIL